MKQSGLKVEDPSSSSYDITALQHDHLQRRRERTFRALTDMSSHREYHPHTKAIMTLIKQRILCISQTQPLKRIKRRKQSQKSMENLCTYFSKTNGRRPPPLPLSPTTQSNCGVSEHFISIGRKEELPTPPCYPSKQASPPLARVKCRYHPTCIYEYDKFHSASNPHHYIHTYRTIFRDFACCA